MVLVIASDLVFAERLRRELRACGVAARQASSWSTGVQQAGIEQPELAIVDENQVDLDGLSVLALLKAHPKTAEIPVVVAAGRDRRELRRRAEHLGAADTALKTELTAARVLSYLAGVRAPAARAAPASSPIPL